MSLHKDLAAGEAKILNQHSDVVPFGDLLEDYSDTAALISRLDLVGSVDTSVAHLADSWRNRSGFF